MMKIFFLGKSWDFGKSFGKIDLDEMEDVKWKCGKFFLKKSLWMMRRLGMWH